MFSEVVVSLAISVETFLSDAFKNVYHAVAGEISGIVLFFFLLHMFSYLFAGSPIFVMKLAGHARHLEVQLLQISMVTPFHSSDVIVPCSVVIRKLLKKLIVTIAKEATFGYSSSPHLRYSSTLLGCT